MYDIGCSICNALGVYADKELSSNLSIRIKVM